ncbi:serine hydrolase domain-containing protein [Dokdonella fugitiva]|uniref:CubicO group peptidase (Beta-lactamase class C family) n=1 Tax=Dokdonella fugitiva TaxID=328517 RepID=A0A4R2I4T8_9GAMM|nr:serine hydrolase domain-containing protein [Dokdonella fugitiva]TCO38937.1 CubicO group peptidase (beta-lactamase class C family) [Dokdonella fugitiva]
MRSCLALLAMVVAAPAATAGGCDFTAVSTRVQQLVQGAGVADAGIAIGTPRGLVFKQYLHAGGGPSAYDDSVRVPVASASKLLAGVRIMQLVDRGAIALDAPVSGYLPAFTGLGGTMTMRQMFSHTAGYGDDSDSLVLALPVTLAEDVAWIAAHVEMPFPPPGAWFAYGGISMQVGGEVAEVRGGEDWQAGWQAHVGAPLGATGIDWQGLGPTANYRIAGGAEASLPDYARVLAMLLGDGVGNGWRILSPQAIATLASDQTAGAALAYSPPGADGRHAYGIGAWIETFPPPPARPAISSIGKFGYAPWVDFDGGFYGVIMVEQQATTWPAMGEQSHDAIVDIDALVRAQPLAACVPVEIGDEVFRDGSELP